MSRARAARKPLLGEVVATAKARFTGIPARKARYVADLIRGLTVAEAELQLAHVHRPSAVPIVGKVLFSAVANAKEKEAQADPQSLVIGEIFVDGGPILKRFQARAMGRACTIRKRMSHVTIKLYTQG
jgi:large subunit ribosomal protein L22